MSYQVLARKWRPHSFETLIGQDHVVRALEHALTENRLHHAYLFTGTRGVGKTTISRILAKCLNCTGADGKGGITAEPCGVCEACRAIDEDRFVDYIEMDAASTRGIDDMVSLLERAKYAPTNARFKVYMIDEVHQLTTAAFNAMLKTLEEPPEYVKFILATTDPQKVPVTVLSRCLQFNLKSLSPQAIGEHMQDVLQKEGIPFEEGGLKMLASGARGSMRDGLSLLDQAIAYSGGNVTVESVRGMLGTIDSTTLLRLLGALAEHNAAKVIEIADEIGARSLSYTQALKDLSLLLHQIAMAQMLPAVIAEGDPDAAELRRLAQALSPDEVQLFYQIAIHGRNDMHLAPDEYAGFTMALLRMMAFTAFDGKMPRQIPAEFPKAEGAVSAPAPAAAPVQAPAAPKVVPAAPAKPAAPVASAAPAVKPAPAAKPVAAPKAAPAAKKAVPAEPDDVPPWLDDDDAPYVADIGDDYIGEDEFYDRAPTAAPQEAPRGEPVAPIKLDAWLDAARKISLDPKTQALVINAELDRWEGSQVLLKVAEEFRPLTDDATVRKVEEALKKVVGKPVELIVEVGSGVYRTFDNLRKQEFIAEKKAGFAKMCADKEIAKFAQVFGSTLDERTFELLDAQGKPRRI